MLAALKKLHLKHTAIKNSYSQVFNGFLISFFIIISFFLYLLKKLLTMSRKERVQLIERTSSISSNIMCSNNENMLPPKFPALKSKGRALANAINRDLNRSSLGKAALERQRENASKLASGRSVVDKADKENQVVRNKPEVRSKHQFPSQVYAANQPQLKTNKLKSILEEKQNKLVKSESVISLYTKQEVQKVGKKTKQVIVEKVEEKKPVILNEQPKPEEEKIPPEVKIIDHCQEEHSTNEFLLGIYADDIHNFLKTLEASQPIKQEYLTPSHIMTQNMRSLLVDWLFEVQQLFKLLNETIHLAIALLDRFMQDHPGINRNELQLVGVSCIFLASKYEEMYPPDLDDLVDISAKAYSKTQIIKMEQLIFSALDFQMGRPSPAQFLRRYGRAGKVDVIIYCLAKYFIDLSLVSYCLCHVPPSLIAASALYLSLYLLSEDSESEIWTPTLIYYSGYTKDQMKPIIHKLASVVWNAPSSKYQAVKNKYLDPKKTHCVSALQELRSEKVYKLTQEV